MADNRRLLHWVFKISNLKKACHFLENVIGMKVLRHEEFNDGCEASCNGPYSRPWSKTMIGCGPELTHFVLELTYNYGIKNYERGNDYRYITVNGKDEILNKASEFGYDPIEEDGETFLELPVDGYRFRLVDEPSNSEDPILNVSVNSSNLEQSEDYYCNVLNMTKYNTYTVGDKNAISVGYDENKCKIEIVSADEVNHAKAFGRVAIAITDIQPIVEAVAQSKDKVLHEPVSLDTPGKATVKVIIIQDRDDYEICFVGEEGFNDLSTPFDGCDNIDWEKRASMGADKV
eukprot:TRINITY_DN111_c0_g1_i2.p1 TRINITY_DN111_c0_g1~~TRINITY_DN111_c0_g1_i2.p1  ORF type:complete len:289 (-),score=115.44 TRINITY_DN111_c0_g1_i2:102-968(-)